MSLEVRLVASPRDFDAFVELPYRLHRNLAYWVPPLRSDLRLMFDRARNPFFEHAEVDSFLALRDGGPGGPRVVGRVAAIHNRAHNEFHRDRVGFFGFFECEDDPEAARALLDAAGAWTAARGLDILRGPMNFSTNDDCGLLVRGFHRPPMIMMPFNPDYYPGLVEGAGFRKAKDLLAYVLGVFVPRAVARAQVRVRRRYKVRTRPLDVRRFADETRLIRTLYNAAWERNWGFVPMTEREIDYLAAQLRPVVVPELVRIAELEGEPVGFSLVLPDFNEVLAHLGGRLGPWEMAKLLWLRRRIRGLRVLTLGVRREFRNLGADLILYHDLFEAGVAMGMARCECSWVLEDNEAMNRGLERIGGVCDRVYRIYDRPVAAGS